MREREGKTELYTRKLRFRRDDDAESRRPGCIAITELGCVRECECAHKLYNA